MFNWSFLPMDSTNSNALFRFDVLLHPRLFCFVINTADTCKYMLDHVERSVLTSIKTKTVPIKSLFFQVRKCFISYSSYMQVIEHLTYSLKINFHSCSTHSSLSVLNCFSSVSFLQSQLYCQKEKLVLKITTVLLRSKSAVFYQSQD